MSRGIFNKKTVAKFAKDVRLTDEQKEAARQWLGYIADGTLVDEKKNYLRFSKIVLEKILGYPQQNITFEDRVEFKYQGEKNLVAIEAKGTDTKDLSAPQPGRREEHRTPMSQTHDYMGKFECDYGVCTNYKIFRLLRPKGYARYHEFDFTDIVENEGKLREVVAVFSRERLADENTASDLADASLEEEKDFTSKFYKLYHQTRVLIVKEFRSNGMEKDDAIRHTQIFLNRMIFMFFAEDRELIDDEHLLQERIPDMLKNAGTKTNKVFEDIKYLFKLFCEGSEGHPIIHAFNGGLFDGELPSNAYFRDLKSEKTEIKIPDEAPIDRSVREVIKQNETLNPIIANLMIMESYDFETELDVNILGHIFEQSMGDIKKLKNDQIGEDDGVQENEVSQRKRDGVYYTPDEVTDYICRNTIIPYLSRSGRMTDTESMVMEWASAGEIKLLETKFNDMKILDPSCGSGAFLIKAVDIMLEVSTAIRDYREAAGHYDNKKKTGFIEWTKWSDMEKARDIIKKNICGVDINEESVEITKLSMFLKMATKKDKLPVLSENIQKGNSLTGKAGGFEWDAKFPEICGKDGRGFHVIIGNPPYVRQEHIEEKEHMKIDNGTDDTMDNRSDLSCYFYYHFIPRMADGGKLGFINTDSWMHRSYGKALQAEMLKYRIDGILHAEFNVFDDANIKTTTTFLTKSDPPDEHDVWFANSTNMKDYGNSENIWKKQNALEVGNWMTYLSSFELSPTVAMVPISSTVKVKRGKTTGADKFFAITPDVIEKYGIDEKYFKRTIDKRMPMGKLRRDSAKEYLLNVNESREKLALTTEGMQVLQYIDDNEEEYSKGDTASSRGKWYSLNLPDPFPIFLSKVIDNNLKIFENDGSYYARDNCDMLRPNKKEHERALLAYFSSSWFLIQLETYGHTMGGGGHSNSRLEIIKK